jgi:hypothetical protein
MIPPFFKEVHKLRMEGKRRNKQTQKAKGKSQTLKRMSKLQLMRRISIGAICHVIALIMTDGLGTDPPQRKYLS